MLTRVDFPTPMFPAIATNFFILLILLVSIKENSQANRQQPKKRRLLRDWNCTSLSPSKAFRCPAMTEEVASCLDGNPDYMI
jgi:hypothetical protein